MWDTLVVGIEPQKADFAWTVHMPDSSVLRTYKRDKDHLLATGALV